MDRAELADFLRRCRERLRPGDVGLPPGLRRRTPGLKRDEVAVLAGMSTDYYTRLEQQRGPHPSVAVLSGLARALRLTDDEREHMFLLAGQAPPRQHTATRRQQVSPGLLYLLSRLDDVPAFVIDDAGEILVQTRLSRIVSGDVNQLPPGERNYFRRWFLLPESRRVTPEEDWQLHSRTHVSDLRATAARRQGDPDIAALVGELRAGSAEFDQLWREHTVAVRRADKKRLLHPEVGLLDLLCEHVMSMSTEQTLVVLHPRPGSDCQEKLDLLRVIGQQDLSPAQG